MTSIDRFGMMTKVQHTVVVLVSIAVVLLLTKPAMAVSSDPSIALSLSSADSGHAILDGPTFEDPWIPSFEIVDRIKDLLKDIIGSIGKHIISFVNNLLFEIPAPGKPLKPSTWVDPKGGIWATVMGYAKWSTGFASMILIASALLSFMYGDAHTRRQAWKRWVVAVLMIAGTWTIVPLALHLTNQIAMGLAPSGSEFLSSWGGLGKMAVGLIVLVALAIIQPTLLGIAVLVLAIEKAIILLGVAFWPLAWSVRSLNIDTFKSISDAFIFLFGVVIVTKVVQALAARLLFSLPLGTNPLSSLIIISAGVGFIFIILPWKMIELSYNAAGTSLGMRSMRRGSSIAKGGKFAEKAANRVGNTPVERAKAIGSGAKTTGSAAKSTAGKVKSGASNAKSTANNWRSNGSSRGDGTGNGTWGGNRWRDHQPNSSSSNGSSNTSTDESGTSNNSEASNNSDWKQAEQDKRDEAYRNKGYE